MKGCLSPIAYSFIGFLMLLGLRSGFAQDFDSSFWAKHPLHQPDSLLLKDSFWFPPDPPFEHMTYTRQSHAPSWAGAGAQFYSNGGQWHAAFITLRADHTFVFEAGFEVGHSLDLGRWWEEDDSVVTLQWNDTLSLHLCRDPKFDAAYFHRHRNGNLYPWPIRIDRWQFIRREKKLVSLSSPLATNIP
jgi:hypothetical protein